MKLFKKFWSTFDCLSAFTATKVVNRNNPAALWAGIFFLLPSHKFLKSMFAGKPAVSYQACVVTRLIAFFQAFYPFTGEFIAFIAIGKPFFPYAVLYFAAAAMLRLS